MRRLVKQFEGKGNKMKIGDVIELSGPCLVLKKDAASTEEVVLTEPKRGRVIDELGDCFRILLDEDFVKVYEIKKV